MNNSIPNQIKRAIELEVTRLGSANKVATSLGVAKGTISAIRNDNHENISVEMWAKIARQLNVKAGNKELVFCEHVMPYMVVERVLNDSKDMSLFQPIASPAGSGKTRSINHYAHKHASDSVFVIRAREWAPRAFLLAICKAVGIETNRKYMNIDQLITEIISAFSNLSMFNPLLIVDEADKLKDSTLRTLIPLYNELKGNVGVVISGTEHLQKRIETGVRLQRKGFDELHSRFGRSFYKLPGFTKNCIKSICYSNGITDPKHVMNVFRQSEPTMEETGVRSDPYVSIVKDARRLERVILTKKYIA